MNNRLTNLKTPRQALVLLAAGLGFVAGQVRAGTITNFLASFDACPVGALSATASTAAATLNSGTAAGTWSYSSAGFGGIGANSTVPSDHAAAFDHNTTAQAGLAMMPENGVAAGSTYPVTVTEDAPGANSVALYANFAGAGGFTGNNSTAINFNWGSFGNTGGAGFKYAFVRGLDAAGNEVFELLWYQGSTSATCQILARSASDTTTYLAGSGSQPVPQGSIIATNFNPSLVNGTSASTEPTGAIAVGILLTNNQVTYTINGGTPATFALNSGATSISKLEFCEVWNKTIVDSQNAGFWLDDVTAVSETSASQDAWTGASSASWNTAGNWNPNGVPTPGDFIYFNNLSTANLATVLNADFSVETLTLTTPSGPVSIGGANTLTLGSGGIDLSGASQNLTVSAPIVLDVNQTWNVASNQTLSANGGISGSATLTLSGGGTVSLGSAASYTGDTTISSGTLQLGAANAIPSGVGLGKVNLNGGTLDLSGHSQTLNGLVSTFAANSVVDTLSGGTPTLTIGDDNSYGTFDGVIQNTAGTLSLVKAGAGQVFLRGQNTYSGSTTILNGSLKLGYPGGSGLNRLPTTTVLTLGDGVNNTGGELILNSRSVQLAGLTTAGGGYNSIVNENGSACTLTVSDTADYAFSGTLGGFVANDNNFSLAKSGDGTLTLSGYNTYAGNTIISGGTLALSGSGSIASSPNIVVAGGAALDVSAASYFSLGSSTLTNSSVGAVFSGSGDFTSGTLALLYDGTNACFVVTNGAMTLSSSTVITVNNTGLPLQPGSYTIIAAATSGNPGSVTGSLPTSVVVTGNGSVNGALLQFNANGGLDLVVSSTAWSGAVDNSWTTPGNWTSGTVPNLGDPILFNEASVANLTTVLNADFFISQLTITTPSGPVSIGGANNLYIGSGGVNMSLASQNLAITAPVNVGASQTWTVTNSRTLSVSGGISGSGAVTIDGGGKVLLGGVNTYAGDTTVNSAAALQALAVNALPSGAGVGNVNNNGAFDLNGYSQTVNGLTNNGVVDNTAPGAVTLTAGGNDAASTVNGTIQNTGGALALVKTGAGNMILNHSNSYSGGTTVNGGSVYPKDNASFGTGPVIANSGRVYCVSNNVLNNALSFTNSLTLNNGTLELGGGSGKTLNWSGPVSVTGNSLLHADGNTAGLTLSGAVDLGGGNATLGSQNDGGSTGTTIAGPIAGANGLVKVNSGTLTLSGTNTFAGAVRAAGGTLSIRNVYALQNATVDYNAADSGAINYNNLNCVIGALTGSRDFAFGPTLFVGNNNSSTHYDGALSGGGSIVKIGTGTWTLTGTNTYSGSTTINGGTLALSGNGSLASPVITVAGGANLDVSGLASPLALGAGQALGNSSAGAVLNGNADCSAGKLAFVYDGVHPSLSQTNGTLTLSASTVVEINNSGVPLAGGSYIIVAAATTGNVGAVTGTLPAVVVTGGGAGGPASVAIDGSGDLVLNVSDNAWTGATDNFWTTPGNWVSGSVPNSGDPILFNSASAAHLATVLNADFNISQLSVTTPAGPVSVGGANLLTIGLGGINLASASQNLAISAPLALGASQTWAVTNSRTLSVSGGVSGGASLAIAGGGKVLLGGTNTYTGDTTISSGALQFGAANALPSGAGVGNLNVNSSLDLNGYSQAVNALTNNGVVDNTAAGAVTLTVGRNNAVSSVNGIIQNSGGALTLAKTGNGNLTLNSSNNYSGGTLINAGNVYPKDNSSFGTGPITVNGGIIYAVGGNYIFSNAVTLNGGKLEVGGGTGKSVTWAGPVGVTADSTLSADGGTSGFTVAGALDMGNGGYTLNASAAAGAAETVIAGSVSGSSGTIEVISGTLKLSGTNTFGGTLRATNGTLSINNVYAAQYATLDYNGADSGLFSYSGLPAIIGAITGSRNHLNYTANLSVGNNNSSTSYDGAFIGSGSITKIGTGTWTLTGTNDYTGNTTINAGTLALSGIGAISGSTNIIVAGGATFDVSAKIPGFALKSRTLANSSAGAVLAGSSDCGAGTLSLVFDGVHPAFVQTNGALTLSASTVVTVNNTGAPLGNGSYPLIAAAMAGNVGQVSGPLPAVVVTGNGTPGAAGLQINGAGGLDLVVSGATPSQPTISKVTVAAGNLILQGTNGAASGTYAILTSTNVALPLSNWTTNTTGTFTAGGAFSNAIPVTTEPKRFFLIKQP